MGFTFGFEPYLALPLDANVVVATSAQMRATSMHPIVMGKGKQFLNIFSTLTPTKLPTATMMGMVGLQTLPSVFNGLHLIFVGQCLTSLLGGVVCCLCGA